MIFICTPPNCCTSSPTWTRTKSGKKSNFEHFYLILDLSSDFFWSLIFLLTPRDSFITLLYCHAQFKLEISNEIELNWIFSSTNLSCTSKTRNYSELKHESWYFQPSKQVWTSKNHKHQVIFAHVLKQVRKSKKAQTIFAHVLEFLAK